MTGLPASTPRRKRRPTEQEALRNDIVNLLVSIEMLSRDLARLVERVQALEVTPESIEREKQLRALKWGDD